MERTAHHIIQQQVFDIHSKRREKYAILQSRFSRLFQNDLFPMLEMYIDKEIPAHFNARIDTLTVDLGTVSYDNLEQEIIKVFIESFKKALQEIIGDIPAAGVPASTKEATPDSPDRNLEVMAFFLLTGALPWWAPPDKYADVVKITDELLTYKKNDFKELLYSIGTNETVRKRLSYQFPKPYIQAVITLLEPDKAPFIFQYHEEVVEVQAKELFVQAESKEFEKALWLFVLDYLLVDRGSIFEERSFVRSSIYKMAMFFNVDYEQILIAFYEAVQKVSPALKRSGGLGLIIEYVYNDHFGQHYESGMGVPAPSTDDENEETLLLHKLKSIQYYLVHGSFLFESSIITKGTAIVWLHELFDKSPSLFNNILTDALQHTEQQRRLFELLDEPLLKKLTGLLATGNAGAINRYWEVLQFLHTEPNAIISAVNNSMFMYQSAIVSLWQLRKGNFQLKTFIKEHLLALSGYYNVDHKKMARVLLQAIIQQQINTSRHDPLLVALTELLKHDEKEALLMVPHTDSLLPEERRPDDVTGVEALKFYFYYGFLPWWARAGNGKSALQYVDELLAKDAGKAHSLMHFMLSDAVMRRRLVSEFSASQLIDLFKKLPGATRGIPAYEALLQLLKQSFVGKLMADEDVRTLLLLALLEGYGSAGKAFPLQILILHVVQQIAGVLHIGPFFIINSLNRTVQIENAGYSSEFKEALHTVKNALYNTAIETSTLYVARNLQAGDDELVNYISEQLQHIFATRNAVVWSTQEIKELVNELLGFSGRAGKEAPIDIIAFISNTILKGKQIDREAIMHAAEKLLYAAIAEKGSQPILLADKLLVQLVLWLYRQKPEQVKAFVESAAARAPEKILHLYHLLTLQPNKEGKVLADQLRELLKSLILLHGRELAKTTWVQFNKIPVGDLFVSNLPDWALAAVASEMAVSVNVIEIIQRYATSSLKEGNIETAALALLKKMFSAQNLSDAQMGISNNEFPVLLKELILIVYRQHAADIKQLLQTLALTSPQFNLLYLLFSKAATPAERSIFYLIKIVAEEKLIVLLKRETSLKHIRTSRLSEAISMLMEQNDQVFIRLLNTKEYSTWLLQLSSPWVSDEMIDNLITVLQPASGKSIAFFLKEFRLLLRHTQLFSIDKETLMSIYRQLLLGFIAGNTRASNLMELIKAYFDYGEQQNRPLMLKFYLSFTNLIRQVNINNSILGFIIPQLKQESEQRVEAISRQLTVTGLSGKETKQVPRVRGDAALLMQIKNELNQKSLAAEQNVQKTNYPALEEPEVEKIYIDNSGLVLLYPFLSTYFMRLGLLEKGKFIDASAQQRAIHLLAFITDGKEQHAEHTLPLNKMLCGLPLNEPVDHAFSITNAEQELSIQMLRVVFQRWDKLKNSSIEGFRDAFLKRHGMLTRSDEGWNLRVEQRGYDILLDTIPWGFRFIKSSWMDVTITVEWM